MSDQAPANWYADPLGRFTHRYWDGLAWTEHVAIDGQQSVDPLHPGAPAEVMEMPIEQRGDESSIDRGPEADVRSELTVSRRVGIIRRTKNVTSHSEAPSLEQMVQQLRHEAPRQPLDEQVEVAGETFAVKGIKKVFRDLGMPISERGTTVEDIQVALVPEPWNPHDPNAVAVMVGLHHVGYLPADLSVDYIAPLGSSSPQVG
jgi:hypothetical protein